MKYKKHWAHWVLIFTCPLLQAQDLPDTEVFLNSLTRCAIGSEIEVGVDLIGSISDIYEGDRSDGYLTIKNEAKFLEHFPIEDRLKAYQLYQECIVDYLDRLSYQPGYKEPTSDEIRQAIYNVTESRGGVIRGDSEIIVENPLAGMSAEIVEFEKLGCQIADVGAGYFCNYLITIRYKLFSNERSSAGQAHADAITKLLNMMMGGETTTSTQVRRFIKADRGWLVSEA